MKMVIYTFSIYDESPDFIKHTIPTVINYANEVGAQFKWVTSTSQMSDKYPRAKMVLDYALTCPAFYKLYALIDFVYSQNDKMMLIDDDILIRNNAFNLFGLHSDDTLLASQNVGESGVNHLCKKGEGHSTLENLKTTNKGDIEHLTKNLRCMFNSGLYVIDRLTANRLIATFNHDFCCDLDLEQGYLHNKIAEARIEMDEIPEMMHDNPAIEKEDVLGFLKFTRHTDFFHFNNVKDKSKTIEEFYEKNDSFFCKKVIVVGSMEDDPKVVQSHPDPSPNTNERPKIAVCQLADEQYHKWFPNCVESVKRYCLKHGYDYIGKKGKIDESTHINYQKPLLLLNHINDYDYIMWIDLDVAIINDEIKLEDRINSVPPRDVYYCEDPSPAQMLNSGVLIFKNSAFSTKILEKWWEIRDPGLDRGWRAGRSDQGRLTDIMSANDRGDETATLPSSFMNTFPKDYRQGDFILHFMGYLPKDSDRHVQYCYDKFKTLNLPNYWSEFKRVPASIERSKPKPTAQDKFNATFEFKPEYLEFLTQQI